MVSSVTVMAERSEVSFSSSTTWFPSDGMEYTSTWGRTTFRKALQGESPMLLAASNWTRSMALKLPRRISET